MVAGATLVRDWIARAAGRNPDKPWIFSADDDRVMTYGELQRLPRQLAGFLRAQRIGRNVGVLAYGATICTIHVEMNRPYLADLVAALDPRLIVVVPDLGLDDALPRS